MFFHVFYLIRGTFQFQFALLFVFLVMAMLTITVMSDDATPEPAANQPPPGFDSGFNGPTAQRDPNNEGVHDPGIQTFP